MFMTLAAFGSKLFSVRPGIVLISKIYSRPLGFKIKSLRENPRHPIILCARSAVLFTAWIKESGRRAGVISIAAAGSYFAL